MRVSRHRVEVLRAHRLRVEDGVVVVAKARIAEHRNGLRRPQVDLTQVLLLKTRMKQRRQPMDQSQKAQLQPLLHRLEQHKAIPIAVVDVR